MTSRDFCYWLQGFFEINDAGLEGVNFDRGLVGARVDVIRKHLALVFAHEIDKTFPNQDKLNAIHVGKDPGDVMVRC